MEFNDFIEDKKTEFAVIRALEIIGETTKNIPEQYGQNILMSLGSKWRE